MDENHELFSKNKKVIGKFKIKTTKNNWINECMSLNVEMIVKLN